MKLTLQTSTTLHEDHEEEEEHREGLSFPPPFPFFVLFVSFVLVHSVLAFADEWPRWRGPTRDAVWRETGIIEKFEGPEIKPKWKVSINQGYSSPTVANGRVYLMERLLEPDQAERVRCFDWKDGRELWSHSYPCVYKGVSYPDGPRSCVVIEDGRAYSIGTMGDFYCFEAASGKVLWSHDLFNEYRLRVPDWGVAAAPYVDGDQVVVIVGGSPQACAISFDRKSGKEKWHALPDRAGYCEPVIVTQAGKRVMIVWTGERVVGIDPNSGKLYWEHPYVPKVRVGAVHTPVVNGDLLFVSSWHEGSLMLRLRQDRVAVDKVWQRTGPTENQTDALHSLMTTPLFRDGYIYGIDTYAELRCISAQTGDRIWENQSVVPRARNVGVHFIYHGDKVWMFNEKGELIITKLSPKGYEEISRALLIKPTRGQFNQRGGVVWSHPAFAYKHVFIRNDEELVCASLEAKAGR